MNAVNAARHSLDDDGLESSPGPDMTAEASTGSETGASSVLGGAHTRRSPPLSRPAVLSLHGGGMCRQALRSWRPKPAGKDPGAVHLGAVVVSPELSTRTGKPFPRRA